jgi:hypothetical protein
VEEYNRRIQKHMKIFENTEVIKVDLDGRGFTQYGQHMNARRKELMVKGLVAAIKRKLKVCERRSISMKLKEDPSKDNQGLGEAKNGIGEGKDPIENQNSSISVESNKSRKEEDKTAMKGSTRCWKTPVTRGDDFFCGERPAKKQSR